MKGLAFLFLMIAGLAVPHPAKAQLTETTITVTGTVASGTDTTGVFGAPGSLTGDTFTLTFTVDPTQGTLQTSPCGSTNYFSKMYMQSTSFTAPASAVLQVGSGGGQFAFGTGAETGDMTLSNVERQINLCSSQPWAVNSVELSYTGAYSGSATVGNANAADIFPPSGGTWPTNADWSSTVSPAITADSTKTFPFSIAINLGGAAYKGATGTLAPSTFQVVQAPIDTNALTNGSGCPGENPSDTIPQDTYDIGQSAATDFRAWVGDPINPASGNVFEYVTDYATAGPNVLAFRRYYNGLANKVYIAAPLLAWINTLAQELGSNWRSNYDGFLQITTNVVSAERPDGLVIPFRLNGTTWTPPAGIDATLTQAGSTWTLTLPDDSVETYSTASTAYGELQSIKRRNGYTLTMGYTGTQLTSVTDSYSRQITLSYTSGLLHSITTPDSTTVSYGYTAVTGGNVLTSVSYPTTPATSLTYQYTSAVSPSLLTGIQDGAGNQLATWTYDSQMRGTSSKRGGTLGADSTTVAYNADGSITVMNALGVADTYAYTKTNGTPRLKEISRASTTTTAAATETFAYDANGYLASRTDWNGNTTIYVNNSHGQPTSVTEAAGTTIARTTTTAYDPTFIHLPDTITMPGLTVTFTYDTSGNPLTKTETDTTTGSTPYSTNGQTRVTQWTWSATGEMLTVQLPRTDVVAKTTNTYATDGALTSITDALSNATSITSHTSGGRPLTIVDPNSVTTTIAYDSDKQRVATSTLTTLAGNLTTTNTYDSAGMLHSVQRPDGSTLTYGYDAADRLTSVTDLPGNSIAYTLDALGDKTQTQWKDTTSTVQRSTTGTFDALGRMLTHVGGMSQTTTYTYDKNGNTLTVKDPDLHTTTLTYDHLNRLSTSADPSPGGTTTYTYDAHDRVTNVQDPLGHNTAYTFDGFGDKIQVVSPDSGTTVLYYNPDRDLTKQVLAGSLEADMTYDADDRLTGTSYPADSTLNTALTYDQTTGHGDGIGRLTSATDKIGSVGFTYDERGNITAESRVATGITTLNTSYAFDAGNNVSSITYPSGTVVAYGRDSMGRVTSVTAQPPGAGSPSNVVTSVAYEPFGPVTGLTYGNGITGTYSYDADYRTTSRVDAGSSTVMNLAYTYDAADNVKTITDSVNAANGQTLGYDALERLTSAASGTGGYGSWSWTWDKAHNVSTQVIAGTTTTFNRVTASNRFNTIVTGSTTLTAAYTSAGSLNTLKNGSTTIETLTWNAANELATSSASGGSASYAYDLFGRRLEKLPSGGNTILMQYVGLDPSLLLSENDLHSNQADYIYLGERPIGEVNPSASNLYYSHTDTLGTPQDLTNGSATVVWSATYKAFGNTQTTSGSIVQHLRLPGQYFDSETGYHANGFRVYDPTSTRYVSSDPIGLAGGINTYQYTRARPFNNTDPLGLNWNPIEINEPGACPEVACTPSHGGGGGGGDITDEVGPINYGSPDTEAASAPPCGQCPTNTVTRYVGAGEANTAAKTGYIPNTDQEGNPKQVFVTPEAPLTNGSEAETAYQIGTQNPLNPSSSPTYVITGDTTGVTFNYSGYIGDTDHIQMRTTDRIPVITIQPLGPAKNK
jgi:RHS repeat-associated protein